MKCVLFDISVDHDSFSVHRPIDWLDFDTSDRTVSKFLYKYQNNTFIQHFTHRWTTVFILPDLCSFISSNSEYCLVLVILSAEANADSDYQ